jgi:hypothetical protein
VFGVSWLCLLLNTGTVSHAMQMAKVLTAPRVVVVEKIAELTGISKEKK